MLTKFAGGRNPARTIPFWLTEFSVPSNLSHKTSFAPPLTESRCSLPLSVAINARLSGTQEKEKYTVLDSLPSTRVDDIDSNGRTHNESLPFTSCATYASRDPSGES